MNEPRDCYCCGICGFSGTKDELTAHLGLHTAEQIIRVYVFGEPGESVLPSGLCACGCGGRTEIATRTTTRSGHVKGQPRPYIRFHHLRGPRPQSFKDNASQRQLGAGNTNWRGGEATKSAIHLWVRRNYPRAGVCESCGKARTTEYASVTGHLYIRHRLAFAEMCRPCHTKYDGKGFCNPDHVARHHSSLTPRTYVCFCCGEADDRTRLGGRTCVSCFALTTSEQRALQLERVPPESQDVEGYIGRAA